MFLNFSKNSFSLYTVEVVKNIYLFLFVVFESVFTLYCSEIPSVLGRVITGETIIAGYQVRTLTPTPIDSSNIL